LCNGSGSGKRGEEEREQQLHEGDDLKKQQSEGGGLAEGGVAGEADGGLPGGDAEDAEEPGDGGPRGVMPAAPRHRHEFPREDRTEQGEPPFYSNSL